MTAFKSFEEIISWQKARVLCKEIYILSSNDKFAKDFGLRDQILPKDMKESQMGISNVSLIFQKGL